MKYIVFRNVTSLFTIQIIHLLYINISFSYVRTRVKNKKTSVSSVSVCAESKAKKKDTHLKCWEYPLSVLFVNLYLFISVLGIDGLDLVTNQLNFVFQLLHLAVHLVNQ